MRRSAAVAAAVVVLSSLSACGPSDGGSTSTTDSKTLTVYAASSLKSAFTQIGEDFESSHPGVTVEFSFAGSSDLVAQIQQGAPADVFASADTANMDKAASSGSLNGQPVDFASNTLQIAVPPDNPAAISSLADLARPDVQLVLCSAEVPCGAAAEEVAAIAGLELTPVSEEASVTDVLAKVVSGEADAGLVYLTDIRTAGDRVRGVTFPESRRVVNTYRVAQLSGSTDAELAQAFIEQVTGTDGQKVLRDFGFGKP